MDTLRSHVSLVFDKGLYTKDPMSSAIGQEIIRQSVEMISETGLDQFTFKKLAQQLHSTESTVYRYFQNKHQLATYLASYHWSQMEWRIAFATANIDNDQIRFENALKELCKWVKDDLESTYINEAKLQRMVLVSGFNTFLPLELGKTEKMAYTSSYNHLCGRIAQILIKSHRQCKYPEALATTIVESVHHQMYLQLHTPHLTDIKSKDQQLYTFIHQLFTPHTIKK
jgi:AcrR family transcriptional regulator